MSSNNYSDRFLNAVGSDLNLIERALTNKLHDYIQLKTLVALIAGESSQQAKAVVKAELYHACYVGQLKAERIPGKPGIPIQSGFTAGPFSEANTKVVDATDDDYIIHRDNARRYFQWLGAMPEEGTPLSRWLRGKTADESRKLREDQQDKADFQQMAIERWRISPQMQRCPVSKARTY